MRMHPLDGPRQYLANVRLRLRLDAADALQQQADHLVSHVHDARVETAGYEGTPDQVEMHPHVTGARLRWSITDSRGCVSAFR
jgi:hypothetical protein